MRSKKLLLWVCCALFASLINTPLYAQDKEDEENESLQIANEMIEMQQHIDSLRTAIEKLDSYIDEHRSELSADRIEELEGTVAEMEKQLDGIEQTRQKLLSRGGSFIKFSDDGICFKFNDKDSAKVKKKSARNYKSSFLGLDIGFNTFMDDGSLTLSGANEVLEVEPFRSLDWRLSLFKNGINIVKHKFYFTHGLALDFHNFRFRNDVLFQDNDTLLYTVGSSEFKKSTLSVNYLTLPVMFYFETNPFKPGRSFRVGVGGFGGILIGSNNFAVTKDEKIETTVRDDFNINSFTYGVGAEIGYSFLDFYVKYSLNPIFLKDRGPQLNYLSFGIKLLNDFSWD